MIRLPIPRILAFAAVASLLMGATTASAATEDEPTITFFGGGFGHGVGMSQYGALGRAEAGHSYDEILAAYYANTSLVQTSSFDEFADGDDVDVLISVRSTISVSTPWIDGAPQAGWELQLAADGVPLPMTATTPVTAVWADGTWSATADDVELCDASCEGAVLTMEVISGTHVVLEEFEDGPNVGNPSNGVTGWFGGGKIILSPGDLGAECGSGSQFCVIHGDLTFQEYLYGIAEIPVSWPIEAQKAQAVAARSYAASRIALRQGNGKAYDVVSTTEDQYYAGQARSLTGACGNWCSGVDATAGEVLAHDGVIAETFYSASNGGYTAEPPDVWAGGTTRPYLIATEDPFDGNDANPYAAREYVYSVADVTKWLNEYHETYDEAGDQLQIGTVRNIEIDAPPSGRVSFATVTLTGTEKTSVIYRDPDGDGDDPYGFRLYAALKLGCEATPGCDAMRSTNFSVRKVIPFTDIEYDDYFYVPVQWMTLANLTNGVTPTSFGPSQSNTRGQIATFMWRFAGEPEPAATSGFTDVVADSYYEDAVAWMKERGITTGTSPTEFDPSGTVTRAQAAAFLWRLAGSPTSTFEHQFTDVADHRYYTEAVRWMVEWGITTGTSPTTYSPDDVLTRGQISTFLWRLAGAPEAFADGATIPEAMRAS